MVAREIVESRTILSSEPQHILKACRRDQHHASTPPFQEGIRRDGGAMHQHIDGLRA